MTWEKLFIIWGALFVASIGWDMGKWASRWTRRLVVRWYRKRHAACVQREVDAMYKRVR